MNLQEIADAFNIQASPEQLSGGSQPTFKVGNVVLKRVKETSLENNHSLELIEWIAEFSQALKVEFASGMYANCVGPCQGDILVLSHFQHITAFDQMLLRASIRMLLVIHVLGDVEDWETCSEKKAAELVINYMQEKRNCSD